MYETATPTPDNLIVHEPGSDIFQSPASALVNPVNCVGVMGAGLAKQFRHRFPEMHNAYRNDCLQNRIRPGRIATYQEGNRTIVCLPTKRHWKQPSRTTDVRDGLLDLARWCRENECASVAVPAVGAGLGGLPWTRVADLIRQAAQAMPDTVVHMHPPREFNRQ